MVSCATALILNGLIEWQFSNLHVVVVHQAEGVLVGAGAAHHRRHLLH